MTKAERRAQTAGRTLAKALILIECYDGDPEDVLDEAEIALASYDLTRVAAILTLANLFAYFRGEGAAQ